MPIEFDCPKCEESVVKYDKNLKADSETTCPNCHKDIRVPKDPLFREIKNPKPQQGGRSQMSTGQTAAHRGMSLVAFAISQYWVWKFLLIEYDTGERRSNEHDQALLYTCLSLFAQSLIVVWMIRIFTPRGTAKADL